MEKDKSTESRILDAANEVFVRKGFEGARMQEIADAAGINKSLLHYYFRNKDTLFSAVFKSAFEEIIPQINEILLSDDDLPDKIRSFVEKYTEFLMNRPYLPIFILGELHRNPAIITSLIAGSENRMKPLIREILANTQTGKNDPVPSEHLFVNILAMSIFPLIARPILQGLLFEGDAQRYEKFISERPETITRFFRQAFSADTNGGQES
jgi:AcrR family transcriptional regulator